MLRPSQTPLTDAASGRLSMPFLPTLAVAIVLAAASFLCPGPQPASPGPRAGLEGASLAAEAPGPMAFAPPAHPGRPVRVPATLSFAAFYPLDPAPAMLAEASGSSPARPAVGSRAIARLAAAGRRPCSGRRCVESASPAPRPGLDPLAAARAEVEATGDALLPLATSPFAALADTLAPATRLVGEAAGLMRSGAASVKGSVAMLAECLP